MAVTDWKCLVSLGFNMPQIAFQKNSPARIPWGPPWFHTRKNIFKIYYEFNYKPRPSCQNLLSRLLLTSPLHWFLLPLYISSPQSSQKWSQNIICLKIGFSLQNPPLVFLKENVMQMPSHGLTELGVIKPDSSSSKSCLTYHCPLCLIHSNHTDFLAFLWTCLRAFALAGTSVGHFPFPQIFTCLTLSFPLSIFSNATSPEKPSLIPHHLVTLCSQLCFIFLHYS